MKENFTGDLYKDNDDTTPGRPIQSPCGRNGVNKHLISYVRATGCRLHPGQVPVLLELGPSLRILLNLLFADFWKLSSHGFLAFEGS